MIFMQLSQMNVRYLMFRGTEGEVSIIQLVAQGIIGPDAKTQGSNIAAGIVEAGCVIASGMVASAVISGAPSEDTWGDFFVSLLFFALAQLTLVLYMRAFDAFYIDGTIAQALQEDLPPEHHLHLPRGQMCKQGNVAAAISFVAMAISFSIHIAQAVYTSFELANFFVSFLTYFVRNSQKNQGIRR